MRYLSTIKPSVISDSIMDHLATNSEQTTINTKPNQSPSIKVKSSTLKNIKHTIKETINNIATSKHNPYENIYICQMLSDKIKSPYLIIAEQMMDKIANVSNIGNNTNNNDINYDNKQVIDQTSKVKVHNEIDI